MQFPGKDRIQDPIMDLYYEIEIEARVQETWPWLKQMGYHRGGWYIDTWWDKAIQDHFWPRVVPKEARGTYKPPAFEILPQFQTLKKGELVPDGPAGSAFYEVVDIQENKLLVLYATSHFKYMAPQFVYKTRFAPHGSFCWAFILEEQNHGRCKLISWWQAEVQPRLIFFFFKPFFVFIDGVHQREILKGIKKRAENYPGQQN